MDAEVHYDDVGAGENFLHVAERGVVEQVLGEVEDSGTVGGCHAYA